MAETFIFFLFTNTEGDTVGNRREREGVGARGGGLGGGVARDGAVVATQLL